MANFFVPDLSLLSLGFYSFAIRLYTYYIYMMFSNCINNFLAIEECDVYLVARENINQVVKRT